MSDVYIQFCEEYAFCDTEDGFDADKEWWISIEAKLRSGEEIFLDGPDGCRLEDLELDPEMRLEDDYLGFDWTITNHGVRIESLERANPELIMKVLQKWLIDRWPKEYLLISWSYSCSRPEPGGFGGGSALITAEAIESCDAFCWRYRREELAAAGWRSILTKP